MERLEVESCLASMTVCVDKREQPSARAEKRYSAFSCEYCRCTLDYGDYTYNFTLPNGELLFKPDERIKGHVVIERKMDLTELSGCFTHERARFEREFERAKESGAKTYLLVEDATWENLINGRYRTKFNPKSYLASITAYLARYNITPIFCKQETAGKMIYEILRRELKERLENGFYDSFVN